MAIGHQIRKGHALAAVLISADGILWHQVNLCCGVTPPAAAGTWAEMTPAPAPGPEQEQQRLEGTVYAAEALAALNDKYAGQTAEEIQP
jgi:hypothetical protein